jgi:hypothetical protein
VVATMKSLQREVTMNKSLYKNSPCFIELQRREHIFATTTVYRLMYAHVCIAEYEREPTMEVVMADLMNWWNS